MDTYEIDVLLENIWWDKKRNFNIYMVMENPDDATENLTETSDIVV